MHPTDHKVKDIVLIGGGHAHALVVKMWGMNPLAGIRLTLISQDANTPYSGMLPGLVAGHYDFEQTHIDLVKLCSWAGVRFIQAKVLGLNCEENRIKTAGRPDIDYDVVSINTGSTPNSKSVPGASQYATAVKPVSQFCAQWRTIQQQLKINNSLLNIALVGAGAGGFELLMAIKQAINSLPAEKGKTVQLHWLINSNQVLQSHNKHVQSTAIALCQKENIKLHFNFKATKVTQNTIEAENGQVLTQDYVIWCTAATAPIWPANSGLSTDEFGFIQTNDQLQSTSHKNVFAAGDVATQIRSPRPKAGVFAVRQGPVLFKNLCRYALQKPLKTHNPQHSFLSLLAYGEKEAIASKSYFSFCGKWVWKWKNHIDQKFMSLFNDLDRKQEMTPPTKGLFIEQTTSTANTAPALMRCGGCGAKVGSDVLHSVLTRLREASPIFERDDVVLGLESSDDAAVINPRGQLLAQSVDQFRSMIDDPYTFARIATNHALSDLYAMTSEPQSALASVAMPYSSTAIQHRELYQLMSGVLYELNQAQCTLIGGHTSEAAELSLGLTVNGLMDKKQLTLKTAIRPKQKLILTKAIGTGVILAAHMQAMAAGSHVQSCLDSMLMSNAQSAKIFANYGSKAITDVTGFGLIGHLSEMLRQKSLFCQLYLDKIPLLQGALALSQQGISSTLYPQNFVFARELPDDQQWQEQPAFPLLFDPQTSGGLMGWVDEESADKCISSLQKSGYLAATIIGHSEEYTAITGTQQENLSTASHHPSICLSHS